MRVTMFACLLLVSCNRPHAPEQDRHTDDKHSSPKSFEVVPGLIEVQVLAQEYGNAAAADLKYTGRRVNSEGDVKKIERTEKGDYRVRFEYFIDGINWAEGKVIAIFPASEAEKLAKYDYRSHLVFEGRCEGVEPAPLGEFIVLRDCRVKNK